MIQLTLDQLATLRDWFLPERPGPLVGLHVIQTGNGAAWADRWPHPHALLTVTAGNYSLAGDASALQPADLAGLIAGFVEAPEGFVPLLKQTFPDLTVWDRVILDLRERPRFALPGGYVVCRLGPSDAQRLDELSAESRWIAKTWGGPSGLASSGYAWGALAGGRLVAVACTFFVGIGYEEIGVVTELEFRGLGLSAACAGALCEDILDRGRYASWTTSPDNSASLRVAQKLGFAPVRRDYLYVVGIDVPEPPRRQAD